MKPLPLPLRVAAGLAVTAAERARELPKNVVGLPVTVVSQVLQFSMRLQQHVTELAIKGDEVLSSLRPAEETPEWATFDEDLPPVPEPPTGHNGRKPTSLRDVSENARDPWEQEERALAEDHTEGEFDSAAGGLLDAALEVDAIGEPGPPEPSGAAVSPGAGTEFGGSGITPRSDDDLDDADPEAVVGPSGLGNYDELTLPQLRARLRRFTLEQLEELLAYERAHENRPSFVGMLTRRIGNVQRLADGGGDERDQDDGDQDGARGKNATGGTSDTGTTGSTNSSTTSAEDLTNSTDPTADGGDGTGATGR
ncbi:hypothetical protein FHX82_001639 [Amycolatopsis bartoniae]|nr:hypothetical protein [Amycolatopsis bartoniae]TVT09284.1 lipid droplet-associated protein [Amycolatopsis bartoniae]